MTTPRTPTSPGGDWLDELEQAAHAAVLNFVPVRPATVLRLINELRRTKRAAQTLGHVIEQQGRDVLDATGMHHVIGEDGDGDWAVVWEVLADQAAERRALAAKVAAVEALLVEAESQDWTGISEVPLVEGDRLRAALEAGER